MHAITSLFMLIWTSSWMAVVAVILILLVKKLLRNRLSPRWSYLLWMIILVRLLIPWSPESRWSVYNLISPGADGPAAVYSSSLHLPKESPVWNLMTVLWAAGAASAAFITIRANRKFAVSLMTKARPVANPALIALLDECTRGLSIGKNIQLLETDLVSTPSLYGFWRPKLLMPKSVYTDMDTKEWKYIILHELSHFKRKDIAVNTVMNVLLILHWFNPVLWLGYRKMRQDQEIACDSLALTKISRDENRDYASTLIKLLDYRKRPFRLSNVVGISDQTCYLKRRISNIALNENSYRLSAVGLLAIAVVAALALTGAKAEKENHSSSAYETGTKKCTISGNPN